MNGQYCFLIVAAVASNLLLFGDAFSPSLGARRIASVSPVRTNELLLTAISSGKKKRRRRKEAPGTEATETPPAAPGLTSVEKSAEIAADPKDDDDEEEVDVATILDVAKFKFKGEIEEADEATPESAADSTAYPLPDIKQVLKKKEIEEEQARIEEEKEASIPKIKRSDKKALVKLLEQQPYADADDSFFEEEEYGTVSALLGERAAPFLGIPTGPLQVGHTIGALVIVLMAFVEYPGFPLTNLPTPLREALQGGLGTIYLVNIVLAVVAVFKAGERGQSGLLWGVKTFTVGGIAYDQLTQLPTTEQIEEAKARKGKRALKNRKNY